MAIPRNVSKHLMGTHNHKHVRKVLDSKSEERPDTLSPDILQIGSVSSLNVNCVERSSHGIKSSGIDQNIKLIKCISCLNASLCDLRNRVFSNINQLDV